MKLWLSQHKQAIRLVLSRFKQNSLSTLLIALAIGVTLALPVILYVVLHSADQLVNEVKEDAQIGLYLNTDIKDATIEQIKQSLERNKAIKRVKFVSKADALAALKSTSSNADLISALDVNPLPDAFFIEPSALEAHAIEQLKNELSQLDGIADVQVDDAWLKRLNYLLVLGKKAMAVLTALLGFALFAIIGNTIRMQILTQLEEIEVSQLIGATKSFIRRPFLYAGAIYGLIGGMVALGITIAVISLFNQTLAKLSTEYQTHFNLNLPSFEVSLFTCAVAIVIGMVSAYLAVSKSLSQFSH